MLYCITLVNCCIMSYLLASPDSSATPQDWRVWLEELRDLNPTAEVKSAIRKAEKMLKNQRDTTRRTRPNHKHDYLAEV